MTRLLLIALLSLGLLVAGCGGDDDSDSTAADTAAQTQAQTTPTETTEDDSGDRTTETEDDKGGERDDDGGDDTGADDEDGSSDSGDDSGDLQRRSAALRKAVAQCKDNVEGSSQLSKEAKKDLVELCEKAASGDPEELREVSREVCKRIITDTLPAGQQRDQALKLCEQTGQQQ